APDLFYPRYSDGTWGYYPNDTQAGINSAKVLAVSGIQYTTTNRITSDFTLEQKLDMFIDGLTAGGTFSMDNSFIESGRGVNDLYNKPQDNWNDQETGLAQYKFNQNNSGFDFVEGIEWDHVAGSVNNWQTYRRLFYHMQLDYRKTIAENHNFTSMGLFNRNQYATGSEQPYFREDWVFRTTY